MQCIRGSSKRDAQCSSDFRPIVDQRKEADELAWGVWFVQCKSLDNQMYLSKNYWRDETSLEWKMCGVKSRVAGGR